jgi:hypothetical protein
MLPAAASGNALSISCSPTQKSFQKKGAATKLAAPHLRVPHFWPTLPEVGDFDFCKLRFEA